MRETSKSRFTAGSKRSNLLQVEELVRAAKVAVFFIDDQQVVRPGEIGSVNLLKDVAEQLGARIIREKLEAQFRCAGSDEYIDWLDNVLGTRMTEVAELDPTSAFDFRIVDTPTELAK